jgi:5-hydroxyisourate hydrolase
VSSLSTHVLDVERGAPAVGVLVSLFQGDQLLASAATDANGRVANLGVIAPGEYRLVFEVAEYLRAQARPAPFLQRVSLDFQIDPAQSHYHVPLLMTAYACTSYRGS